MQEYPTTVTSTVTIATDATARPPARVNPYTPPMPAIGRLLELLWSYGPKGTLVDTANRDLAAALGVSSGLIPHLLRTLEDDGLIARVPHTRGTLIEVRQ